MFALALLGSVEFFVGNTGVGVFLAVITESALAVF